MKKLNLKLDLKVALGAVALLLVFAVVMDMAVTSPRIARKHRLEGERDQLRQQLGQTLAAKFRNVDAARALNAPDLDTAIAAPREDAVSYLGRLLDDSGLTRLNLVTVDAEEGERLVSTRFNVRTAGRYDEMVEFVRSLESGSRLAVVDELVLAAVQFGDEIEGRFQVTIHDPKGR